MLQCAPTLPQRDAMLLSITTALGVSLNWLTFTYYGNRKAYPNLLNMTLGSPASGKGSVAWIKQLVMPIHEACLKQSEEEMNQYLRDKSAWDCLGNQKKKQDMPQMPSQRLFIIPGNNSAIGADYGHFGDTLRKGYDNDEISFYRRTEREYKQVRRSCFGICLTGTPSQLFGIIPTAEDGLQSRFLFYVLPEISSWVNQFEHEKHDYYQRFYQWGVQWKSVLDAVRQVATSFELELTPDQVTRFNDHFSQVFGRAIFSCGIVPDHGAESAETFKIGTHVKGVRLRARATGELSNKQLNLEATLREQGVYNVAPLAAEAAAPVKKKAEAACWDNRPCPCFDAAGEYLGI